MATFLKAVRLLPRLAPVCRQRAYFLHTMAIPQTMRALQIHQHGGPEVVHFNDAPVPTRDHHLSTGNTEAAANNILVKARELIVSNDALTTLRLNGPA